MKNKGKILGIALIGFMVLMTVTSLAIKNINAKPIDDDPWFRTYFRRILESEGYLNEHGSDGDWIPEDIVSVNQLVLRPEIPGKITQSSAQYTTNKLDISAKVSASAEFEIEIGVEPVGTTSSSHGLDVTFEGGYIQESTNRETTDIAISYDSENELGFSASVYELKVRQHYEKYRVELWAYWSDGTREYLWLDHYDFEVQTTIIDAAVTQYSGISFDYDDANDRALYPYIANLYEDIKAGEYTDHEETKVWGDLFTKFEDKREESGTTYGSFTIEYTHGWGADIGFGGTGCETSFEISVGGTISGSIEDGSVEIATFETGFYESGDQYRVTLVYLTCGAFWVTGYLDNPVIDPEPEPEPDPDPIPDPKPNPIIDIFF